MTGKGTGWILHGNMRAVPRLSTNGKLGTGFSDLSRHQIRPARQSSSASGRVACPQLSALPKRVPDPASLYRIDLGCSLQHGAFEQLRIPNPQIQVSDPDESPIFFMLRLLDRLTAMGTTPAADPMEYGRTLRPFRR